MQLSLSFILKVLKYNSRCHIKVIHLESTSILISLENKYNPYYYHARFMIFILSRNSYLQVISLPLENSIIYPQKCTNSHCIHI